MPLISEFRMDALHSTVELDMRNSVDYDAKLVETLETQAGLCAEAVCPSLSERPLIAPRNMNGRSASWRSTCSSCSPLRAYRASKTDECFRSIRVSTACEPSIGTFRAISMLFCQRIHNLQAETTVPPLARNKLLARHDKDRELTCYMLPHRVIWHRINLQNILVRCKNYP